MSSLQEALSQRRTRLEASVAKPATRTRSKDSEGRQKPRKRKGSRSRNNTHLIGGHFPAAVAQQWHLLVAEGKINGATGQSLLEEAISDLFVKKGKKALKQGAGT